MYSHIGAHKRGAVNYPASTVGQGSRRVRGRHKARIEYCEWILLRNQAYEGAGPSQASFDRCMANETLSLLSQKTDELFDAETGV
jgi:hypothetical protein